MAAILIGCPMVPVVDNLHDDDGQDGFERAFRKLTVGGVGPELAIQTDKSVGIGLDCDHGVGWVEVEIQALVKLIKCLFN
jgi:hypothetical protein